MEHQELESIRSEVTDEGVEQTLVENVLVAIDLPNLIGSATIAAGFKPHARFSFQNIVEAIERSVADGFTQRDIVECHAILMAHTGGDQHDRVLSHLKRAAIDYHVHTQKRLKRRRSISFDLDISVSDVSSLSSVLLKGVEVSDAPDGSKSDEVVHVTVSGSPYQGEEGVTDLELTNLVYTMLMNYSQRNIPIHTVVIVSGDGDFATLVRNLRGLQYRVEVYGPSGATSRSLSHARAAHEVVYMSDTTPADVSESKRFMFFEHDDEETFLKQGLFENALEDARDPMFAEPRTGEFQFVVD